MELTRELIEKLAKSAKLKFNEEELLKIKSNLADILTYIDRLNEVNTENIAPLVYVHEIEKELRDDIVKPSLKVEEVVKNAPSSEEGAIIVPKVVGE